MNLASSVSILFNETNSITPSFSAAVDVATGEEPDSIAVIDLNADGKADIATANRDSTVSVLLAQ